MKATILSSTMIAAALLTTTAWAQSYVVGSLRPYYRGYYPGYYHASTYEEGVLRGWADVRRATGEYNYNTSAALINREEARSRYLDNREKAVLKYFSIKKINKEYRTQERKPRPTQEEYARLAKEAAPDRLSASQYEPALGKLSWPALFDGDVFAAERDLIDRLIAERTIDNSGLGSPSAKAIELLTAQMKSKLKGQVGSLSASEYMNAKNFLASLEYEAQLPLDVRGVAAK